MERNQLKINLNMNLMAVFAILAAFVALPTSSRADDNAASAKEDTSTPTPGKVLEPSGPSGSTERGEVNGTPVNASVQEAENTRMKALEGSKSRWSFQAQLTYFGSTINHPFANDLPNSGGNSEAPRVNLSGTLSARYRYDATTTMGVGTGITTYTPFQGPSDSSVSNPYADIAKSFKIGKIHNRADFQILGYTDNQNATQYGYLIGLTAENEAYYTFGFGLTVGLSLQLDYNTFKGKSGYPAQGQGEEALLSSQTQYDLYTDPYFEYSLSSRVNLRSVIGIEALGHQNDMHSAFGTYHAKIYQTFGVGVSIFEGWFIYNYVQIPDYTNVATNTLTYGFSTIIDLF